jgi:hypothetical protein
MQTLELRKWVVSSDPELTREAYARIDAGGAECCGCEECFNFAAARHLVYTPEVLDLLEVLGIDPLLEAGVRHDGRLSPGRHAYTVWFYVVGEIESGPATCVARVGRETLRARESAGGGISVGFSRGECDERPDAFLGLPALCLELGVVVPWVSNAPEPAPESD